MADDVVLCSQKLVFGVSGKLNKDFVTVGDAPLGVRLDTMKSFSLITFSELVGKMVLFFISLSLIP